MNRQKLILFILVILLALAIGYAFWASPSVKRVAGERGAMSSSPAQRQGEGPSAAEGAEDLKVRLELLERSDGGTPKVSRNIFAPLYRPAPPKAPPPPPPPSPPPTVEKAPPPPPLPPAPVAQQELARFTFLGYLEKGGEKTVFLSAGGDIFVVKRGSVFGKDNMFRVLALTPEQLVIRQGEDPRSINVPLVESQPLAPGADFQ